MFRVIDSRPLFDLKDKKVKIIESNFTKGQELCNRTVCQTDRNVTYFNETMGAWYCVKCARAINDGSRNDPLCIHDEDRKFYERNIKHQQKLTWSEYKKAKEIFTF
jgi:hypothetical protein